MSKENFIRLFEDSFKNNFDYPALNDYESTSKFTYGEIAQEIEKLHILFKIYQVKPGDKIALVGKTTAIGALLSWRQLLTGQ